MAREEEKKEMMKKAFHRLACLINGVSKEENPATIR